MKRIVFWRGGGGDGEVVALEGAAAPFTVPVVAVQLLPYRGDQDVLVVILH